MHPTDPPFPDRSPGVPRFRLQLFGSLALTDRAGGDPSAVLSQPKRVALLAYLAAATPRGFHRRDTLLALLWPDLDTERARAALRKGVHWLRAELGEEAVLGRGNEELALAPEVVGSDVAQFEVALDAQHPAEALTAYTGDLLAGFHISGAPEFDRWLETERTRLRGRAAVAAWAVADERLAAGDQWHAIQAGRRAVALSPDDEGAVRRLIGLLDQVGNRAGALHAYESFARQLADDYAAQPSVETQRLIAEVRQRVARISGPMVVDSAPRRLVASSEGVAPSPAVRLEESREVASRRVAEAPRRRGAMVAGIVALLALLGAGYLWSRPRSWVTTSSRDAYLDYQRGLAATGRGNDLEALRDFQQAFARDSGFAMAAFEVAVTGSRLGQDSLFQRYYIISNRLADRVSERERLLIRATWADRLSEPAVLSLAESLATRYPEEPAGANLLGRALMNHGDFLGAIQQFRRAAGPDSAALRPDAAAPCTECDALEAMVWSYHMADSLDASARTARIWVRRQPGSAAAWGALSAALEAVGRYDESASASAMAAGLRKGGESELIRPVDLAMVQGDFAEADRRLAALDSTAPAAFRTELAWYRVINLRYQGRLAAALAEAQRYRAITQAAYGPAWSRLPEAIVLAEMGQGRRAAALFDAISQVPPRPWSASRAGRTIAWNLTHEVTALAAIGDTTSIRPLIDSIRVTGALSAYGRDPLLHHYAEGLLLLARGDTAGAVPAFRQAIYSVTGGFSRLNLVLARCLVAQGRPREAIPLLQAPLHSAVEAGNLYATHTELREALGAAFEAAGERDSAVAEYRWVLGAWGRADAGFGARRREVERRVAVLGK